MIISYTQEQDVLFHMYAAIANQRSQIQATIVVLGKSMHHAGVSMHAMHHLKMNMIIWNTQSKTMVDR